MGEFMLAISLLGIAVVVLVLWDAFETIVVPKTVERRYSVSTIYYRAVWKLWDRLTLHTKLPGLRQAALNSFPPLSLIFLFVTWATLLILGFAMIHLGIGALPAGSSFGTYAYFSGVTFFTLGYGDLHATDSAGRLASVIETGTGYGFLAIVISYVPTLYQAFSRREHFIVMLDSRAGSDPTGGELVRRHAEAGAANCLTPVFKDAERWAAEQLETYLSYPIMAYYRSQHDTQSWLTTMTAILDSCSIVLAGVHGDEPWIKELRFQAQATYAMCRHVVVDLSYILDDPPDAKMLSRTTPQIIAELERAANLAGSIPAPNFAAELEAHRAKYEPYLIGLARDLHFTLPAWIPMEHVLDNWERSAWDGEAHF